LAAGIGGLSTLSAVLPSAQRNAGERLGAVVIGDTVAATLRDTLRLVRLIFDAPAAQRVEVAGDFNGWGASPTPLVRDEGSRHWSVTLALRDGEHRYAFVVDDTRWVPDPHADRTVQGDDGRLYSLLSLSRAAN
jgi:1,4-alpha-glucan branching enzyme